MDEGYSSYAEFASDLWRQMRGLGDEVVEDDDGSSVIAEVYEINTVESQMVKVAIDSAAAESVCPKDWAEAFPAKPCTKEDEREFVNANGGPIKHYGVKKVALKTGEPGWERVIGMPFQACDVKRPLAAVRRICEKGNIVQFGPTSEDNFIQNVRSGEKIWLKQERGQYVMECSLAESSTF